MIKIRDPALQLRAVIDDYWNDNIHEAINKEYDFSFNAVIDDEKSQYLVTDNIVEADNNYFQIVYVKKLRSQNGELVISVDAEHVAMALNDPEYNLDFFTADDTPANILAQILADTPFTVGAVEFTAQTTFSIQEKSSRRGILVQFADYIGAELQFNQYEISMLIRRGADNGVQFRAGKNLLGVTKHMDKRKGTLQTAYDVDVLELRTLPDYGVLEAVELGDDVLVYDPDLGVNEKQRIVEYDYSPKLRMNSKVVIANFIDGIEDTISRIERTTLIKEKVYNGIRIGPEKGYEAIRSDNLARTVMNATEGIKIQSGDGSGDNWQDKLYADLLGNLVLLGMIYASGGEIGGWTIEADKLSGDGIVEGGTIRTAETGQRIELSSVLNLLKAINTSGAAISIKPNVSGTPAIEYDNGTDLIKLFLSSGVFAINANTVATDITLAAGRDINLNPAGGQYVNIPLWSMFRKSSSGQTLQDALDAKADEFTGYTGSVSVITSVDFGGSTTTSGTLNFSNGVLASVT